MIRIIGKRQMFGCITTSKLTFLFNIALIDSSFCIYQSLLPSLKLSHPATSFVRDQDATTLPARHVSEAGYLNWAQFVLQWFVRMRWIQWIPVSFRENCIVPKHIWHPHWSTSESSTESFYWRLPLNTGLKSRHTHTVWWQIFVQMKIYL